LARAQLSLPLSKILVRLSLERGKDSRARANNDLGFPSFYLTPFVIFFTIRQTRMKDCHLLAKAGNKTIRHLKCDEWRKVERGEAQVVVGARSAVFAPLKNIGAIIIATCWPKRAIKRSVICGVREISGTSMIAVFPFCKTCSITRCRCDN